MKNLLFVLIALVSIAAAVEYSDSQTVMLDGMRLSFQLGQAYGPALQGQDVAKFNTLVDQYNAFIRANFGEDQNLLMSKMGATIPTDLSKPILIANDTTSRGIVHEIDGANKAGGASYTTNDMNLLPESAIRNLETYPDGTYKGGDYLGGV